MKFSEGDKMLIKRTGEEGYVVTLIDKDMVEVRVGQTTFPIHIDEIDHPYLKWFMEKNKVKQKEKVFREQIPVEKLMSQKTKVASGIHLAFMPVFQLVENEEQVSKIKVFAINHTHFTVNFKYQVWLMSELVFSHQAVLQPFSDIYFHFLDWEMMNEIPRFECRIEETLNKQYAIHEEVIKIRSTKLFEHLSSLSKNNLATFQYTLLQDFKLKIKEPIPFKLNSLVPQIKTKVTSVKDIPKYELDLHIEHLVDNPRDLQAAEIIQIQRAELEKYLQIAIQHQQDKMVIIHGVGKGVLRNEVHQALKENRFIHSIDSGWQSGYGFGATIVHFKY
jgi:DNA-nicking Smr family endonuclease